MILRLQQSKNKYNPNEKTNNPSFQEAEPFFKSYCFSLDEGFSLYLMEIRSYLPRSKELAMSLSKPK
jgi:hypothetical protein